MSERAESSEIRVIEISDERSREATEAFGMIETAFQRDDRHSIAELRLEIEEKRLSLLEPFDFHQLAALDHDRVVATATGVYLPALNSGFVIYLVVAESHRGLRLGKVLRSRLVDKFEENAMEVGGEPLRWVLGEVLIDSPWLLSLVKKGNVIPFDLEYYHPDLPIDAERGRYVLYREVMTDDRRELPGDEVARILYTIYRRAYREPYPMAKANFRAMFDQIMDRQTIGANSEVMGLVGALS